jgi:hypothetical protein
VLNLIFETDGAGLRLEILKARSEFEGEIEGACGIEWDFLRRKDIAGKKTGSGLKSAMGTKIDSCSCRGEALRIGSTASAGCQNRV